MKTLLIVLMLLLVSSFSSFGVEKNPLRKKLKSIIIKHIEYDNAEIDLVVKDLKKRILKLDPEAKGINIILALAKGKKAQDLKVILNMNNIPLETALDYISRSVNMQYFLRDNTVVIASKEIAKEGMEIRTFRAKPHAVATLKRIYGLKIKENGAKDGEDFGKFKDEDIFE